MASAKAPDIVLIVDDSPDTLKMLTDALHETGMTVLVSIEGEHALTMVERITPDVILMDALMPGMDGFETCRRIKASKTMAHVPVIFMTGLTETEHIVRGLEAGGVDYVTKPISPDELIARIRVHLANARVSRGARAALDTLGRFFLATNAAGDILWSTPQTASLLAKSFRAPVLEQTRLPSDAREWIGHIARAEPKSGRDTLTFRTESHGVNLDLIYAGQIGPNEILFRVSNQSRGDEQSMLRTRLGLTSREADVLFWIARGKSNRDIAEILDLSPRTVNKHLEQIFSKLGVENRTSAAAVAMGVLQEII